MFESNDSMATLNRRERHLAGCPVALGAASWGLRAAATDQDPSPVKRRRTA